MISISSRSIKLTFFSTIIIAAMTSQAAPICRKVLYAPSAAQINATLDDLAELRMTLDLERASGPIKTTSKVLEQDYDEKQDQVLSTLDIDLATLQKKLEPRIQALQDKVQSESKGEKKQREEIERNIKATIPRYKLQKQFPNLGLARIGLKAIKFDSKTDTLHYSRSGILYELDLKSGKEFSPSMPLTNFFVSQDRSTLFRVTDDGLLIRTSLINDTQLKNDVMLKLEPLRNRNNSSPAFAPFAMSPIGDKAALLVDNTLFVFDAHTGDILKKIEHMDDRRNPISFLSENEIIATKNTQLTKINLTTGLESPLGVYGTASASLEANSIIVSAWNNLYSYTADTLQLKTHIPGFAIHSDVIEVPGHPQLVAILGSRDTGVSGIYDRSNLSDALFDFNGTYLSTAKAVYHVFITPDSKTVLVFFRDPKNMDIFDLDIWTRE